MISQTDQTAGHRGNSIPPVLSNARGNKPEDENTAAEAGSGERLPQELARMLEANSPGQGFAGSVAQAARKAGCEMLFEIPCGLIGDPAGSAAALARGTDGEAELFFIVFNTSNSEIRILEEGDAPEAVLDFTRSYAGVLGLIAVDHRLTAPLIQ